MHRNRLLAEPEVRLPQPPPPTPSPGGFVLLSPVCFPPATPEQWLWQQWVYGWAFEQAQAVVRPSLPERDLLAAWN
jgi:hypothetical protein